MSWWFRALVLAAGLVWVIAPQLACFMPGHVATDSEKDCCEKMAPDCGSPTMVHACCRTVIRTDVGIAAKVMKRLMPRVETAGRAAEIAIPLPANTSRERPVRSDHAPPPEPEVTSLILRI